MSDVTGDGGAGTGRAAPGPTIAGFQAGYVNVDGWPTWHEVSGEGPAVALLHGGFSGAAAWSAQAPPLASAGFRVYVPERRGHAHTPDRDGPLSYAIMAEDTIAYLEQVADGPAHLVGWSDGAVVALLVAQRRPDLARRLVLIGQYYNSSGRLPDPALENWLRTTEAMDLLRQGYDPLSPDGPGHFPVVYAKSIAMIDTEPELDLATFGAVTAPTLVLQGDRDVVTVEHSAAVAKALPDARLAVLPGTHALPLELPGVINPLLIAFLRGTVSAGFAEFLGGG